MNYKKIEEIIDKLNTQKQKINIMAIVNTLKYLKKGGRVTPAAAAIGTLLNIKPILRVDDEGRLVAYKKVIFVFLAYIINKVFIFVFCY